MITSSNMAATHAQKVGVNRSYTTTRLSDMSLVLFNSRATVVTEFVVKNRKKANFLKFTISLLVNIFWMYSSESHEQISHKIFKEK